MRMARVGDRPRGPRRADAGAVGRRPQRSRNPAGRGRRRRHLFLTLCARPAPHAREEILVVPQPGGL